MIIMMLPVEIMLMIITENNVDDYYWQLPVEIMLMIIIDLCSGFDWQWRIIDYDNAEDGDH